MNKQEKLIVAQIVAGTVFGLGLRRHMVKKGMIKSFFKPNLLIRKPGTYIKCKGCNNLIDAYKHEQKFGTKPTTDHNFCSWRCLHAFKRKTIN